MGISTVQSRPSSSATKGRGAKSREEPSSHASRREDGRLRMDGPPPEKENGSPLSTSAVTPHRSRPPLLAFMSTL
ncbi:hypothetical protein EYF80_015848 [Liparis tanakae]|uniref:Uncharacterized protein n=1 Tax=Liparis tanakae TaxID=230148 RepID=A0A4Z2I7S1_9TELE|nr:hypothetical protein EYF80_015848 [Liparis tanakae]